MSLLGRIALATAILWCILVEVAVAFVMRNFGFEIDGDWFLLISASDPHEVMRFCSLHAGSIAVCVVLIVVLSGLCCWTVFKVKGRWLPILALAFLAYAGVRSYSWGAVQRWKPVYIAFDTLRSTGEYRELGKAGAWTPERANASRPARKDAPNLMCVLGESLTTDRMDLYGYDKPTTPQLRKLDGLFARLGPLQAAYPDTARGLRVLLTEATRERGSRAGVTLPVVLRQRGYRTVLVSAQRHWERYCGIEQMIFAACEKRLYLNELTEEAFYDTDLLPIVRQEMASSDGRPFALFVHMMGSHHNYTWCVPPGYAANEGLDDYDRTVRHTDAVLAELIKSLPPRTLFVFISDHGESPSTGISRARWDPSTWKVPLLISPPEAATAFTNGYDHVFSDIQSALN